MEPVHPGGLMEPDRPAVGLRSGLSLGAVRRDQACAAFLDGTAERLFLLRRCAACAATSEPQTLRCPACGSDDLAWQPAEGSARLVSWAIAPPGPRAEPGTAPVVLVIAELAEGPWWWSQLVDVRPQDLAEGLPLRLDFSPSEDGESVPVFRAA
jgi:uncharacterized OB-fold protein